MQANTAGKDFFFDKLTRLACAGLILLVAAGPVSAGFAHEYTVQAIRTLNFARFTEWSFNALKDSNNIVNLCVIGEPIVQNAFSEVEKRPAGRKAIKILHLSKKSSFSQCKVLFLSGLTGFENRELLNKINGLPILTIGEDDGFIEQGGMVQLNLDQGWLKIIVNLKPVRKAGLAINSRVLRIAKVVYL